MALVRLLPLILLLAGCLGKIDGASDARRAAAAAVAYFGQNVIPVVNRCANCHGLGQKPTFASRTDLPNSYVLFRILTDDGTIARKATDGHGGVILSLAELTLLAKHYEKMKELDKNFKPPTGRERGVPDWITNSSPIPANILPFTSNQDQGTDIEFTFPASSPLEYASIRVTLVEDPPSLHFRNLFVRARNPSDSVTLGSITIIKTGDTSFDIEPFGIPSSTIANGSAVRPPIGFPIPLLATGTQIQLGFYKGEVFNEAGCKDLAYFQTNIFPLLNSTTWNCRGCHMGGNTYIIRDLTPSDLCSNSLPRLNLANIPMSPLIGKPYNRPGFAHQGGTVITGTNDVGPPTFEALVTEWANRER